MGSLAERAGIGQSGRVATSQGSSDARFIETVRLPRRFLVPWITIDVVVTVFFVWLWAMAKMTDGQRVGVGVVLVVTLFWFWGGALWFVATHVVVDDREMKRRVGHRHTRTPLSDVADVRIESVTEPGYARVVVRLRDGSERDMLTRHANEFVAALAHPRGERAPGA